VKGYILVDVHNSEVLVSRNVKFFDLEFPLHSLSMNPLPNNHIYINSSCDLSTKLPASTVDPVQDTSHIEDTSYNNIVIDDIEHLNNDVEDVQPLLVRKSQRVSNPQTHLQDYVCQSTAYPMENYDIIIVGTSLTIFDELKHALHHTFKIKNLGQLKSFLGL